MFRLDTHDNCLQPVQKVSFGELKLLERRHLQEWLAKHPNALTNDSVDDELLIIQKEFSGFTDTNERLDLLALDKRGNLVIIENKLDDSGRDVVWQALKYAGYCSSLSKAQIVSIYQDFINKQQDEPKKNAAEALADFLERDSLDEVVLNTAQSQRVILVAAKFRKEVTNTALWLMGFGLRVQCFCITPYKMQNDVLLDIRQIIPPPEAEEYMISISEKEREEQTSAGENIKRYSIRKKFWTELLPKLQKRGCALYANVSPSTDHWLAAGSGISGMHYSLIFGNKFIRVEFYFTRSSAATNSFAFQWMHERKDTIEQVFGQPLDWQALEGKKACRIQCEKGIVQGFSEENWPEMQDWLCENIIKLEKAISPHIVELKKALQTQPHEVEDDG